MNEAKQMVKDLASQVADVGAVSQNIDSNQMPDEMRALLGELPNWIEQRKGALQRIQQAYDQDPRMRETPLQAQARGMFANGRPGDAGYATAMGEYERQKLQDYQLQQKLAREKSTLDALDLGTFDKLYSSVQKNLAGSKDKQQMVGSADQGWWAYNFDTGEKKLLIPGTLQEKQKARLRESIYDRLKTEGGDQSEWAKKADELSHAIIYKYSPEQVENYLNSGAPTVAGEKVASNSPYPEVKTPSIVQQKFGDKVETAIVSGQAEDAQFNKDVETALASYSDLKISDDEKIKRAYEYASKLNPGVVSSAKQASQPVAVAPSVMTNTPGQLKFDETIKKNWADEIPKLAEAIKANEAKLTHFEPMENMLMAGNLPSGPLHEYLKVVGDFASTYDPNGELAKRYGNDTPAYFGSLMNLVRADIKALGSGTAVSNLDLIVSQMAAGDLRNSPQGNLKLIGLQKYVAAERAAHDKKYVQFINENKDGTGFLTGEKLPPEYALRRKINSKGLEAYVLIPRAQYEKEFETKFKKKPSVEQWKDYSKASIEMIFNGADYAKR